MAGLVAAIQRLTTGVKTWMPGTRPGMTNAKRQEAGDPPLGPRRRDSSLGLHQRHFRHRAPLAIPALWTRARRPTLRLRPHRWQLVGLRRHRPIEEFETEFVAAVLVFVDNHAHMAAALELAEQH